MAVQVIDRFESVQIQVHDRQSLATPLTLEHGLLQSVCQQNPVGQAGQRVKVGKLLQTLLLYLGIGDVGEKGYVILCGAGCISNGA